LWHSSSPSEPSLSHSPSSPSPSFTQSPSPPRSLVRDEQTSPHSPWLVVSRSTCPPLFPSPNANRFVIGTTVMNAHTSRVPAPPWVGSRSPDGWGQIRWSGGWVLHQPPWSFRFDSQTRGARENRRNLCSSTWFPTGPTEMLHGRAREPPRQTWRVAVNEGS